MGFTTSKIIKIEGDYDYEKNKHHYIYMYNLNNYVVKEEKIEGGYYQGEMLNG